jgi:threonine synthase
MEKMNDNIHVYTFDDKETMDAIRQVYVEYGYILDPHGAVGYLAAQKDKGITASKPHYIVLETAHPAKFSEESEPTVSDKIVIPSRLEEFFHKKKKSIKISKDYNGFKREIYRILNPG